MDVVVVVPGAAAEDAVVGAVADTAVVELVAGAADVVSNIITNDSFVGVVAAGAVGCGENCRGGGAHGSADTDAGLLPPAFVGAGGGVIVVAKFPILRQEAGQFLAQGASESLRRVRWRQQYVISLPRNRTRTRCDG